MRSHTRTTLSILVLTGGLLASGCNSTGAGSRTAAAGDHANSGTPTMMNNHSGSPNYAASNSLNNNTPAEYTGNPTTGTNRVAFSSSKPMTAAKSPRLDRDVRLIGLYGEFAGKGSEAGSPLDGSNSLLQITVANDGACMDPTVDRTGAMLAFASTMHRPTSDIYIKNVNSETITQLTSDPADDIMPAFSPDGKTIAFTSNRNGNWDIYTTTLDGRQTVQVTSDNDPELHPSWSPDGKMLVYCKLGSQSSRWELWTVEVANPAVRNFLGYGMFPQWSPDVARNKIVFQRSKQRGSRDYSVWTIDYVNGQAMFPTEIASAANAALINPAWSPDGDRIVFVSVVEPEQTTTGDRLTQSDLWVVNVDGSNRTCLTNGQFTNFQPVWASNGAVYFVSDRSGNDNIWAVAPSSATTITNNSHGGQVANVDTDHSMQH